MILPALTCLVLAAVCYWQQRRIRAWEANNDYLRLALRRTEYRLWMLNR